MVKKKIIKVSRKIVGTSNLNTLIKKSRSPSIRTSSFILHALYGGGSNPRVRKLVQLSSEIRNATTPKGKLKKGFKIKFVK